MRYLITGAARFLGTHLSARLSRHPKFRSVRHNGANPNDNLNPHRLMKVNKP